MSRNRNKNKILVEIKIKNIKKNKKAIFRDKLEKKLECSKMKKISERKVQNQLTQKREMRRNESCKKEDLAK